MRLLLSITVGLLATSLSAQIYRAEWGNEGGAGSGFNHRGPVMSSVVAASAGRYRWGIGGSHPSEAVGRARSHAYALSGYGFGTNAAAVSQTGRGVAEWEFDDVVFSDGNSTPQVLSVQCSFAYTGYRNSNHPSGPGLGAGLQVYVHCELVQGGGDDQWTSGQLLPGSTSQTVTSAPLSLMTNTIYRLRIQTRTYGGGSAWIWSLAGSELTWNGTSFLLPPGVTANSASAGIVNNTRNIAPPAIDPFVQATVPALASGNLDVDFGGGEPGSLGVLMFGGVPTAVHAPIIHWFALGLPAVPLTTKIFMADTNGNFTYTIPLYPALAGLFFGVQAAQLAGAPVNAYGSNAWRVDVQ